MLKKFTKFATLWSGERCVKKNFKSPKVQKWLSRATYKVCNGPHCTQDRRRETGRTHELYISCTDTTEQQEVYYLCFKQKKITKNGLARNHTPSNFVAKTNREHCHKNVLCDITWFVTNDKQTWLSTYVNDLRATLKQAHRVFYTHSADIPSLVSFVTQQTKV